MVRKSKLWTLIVGYIQQVRWQFNPWKFIPKAYPQIPNWADFFLSFQTFEELSKEVLHELVPQRSVALQAAKNESLKKIHFCKNSKASKY